MSQGFEDSPRGLVGAVLHADVASGAIGGFGADCSAIDAWRMSLRTGTSVPRPAL
jgi:hypothetical protein